MRCKIVRTQKLMWRNIMRSIRSQKTAVLHYSIDIKRLLLTSALRVMVKETFNASTLKQVVKF